MPIPKSKWMPEPRGWTAAQVCAYIGMSVSWWQGGGENLLKTKHGFPVPSPATGQVKLNETHRPTWIAHE